MTIQLEVKQKVKEVMSKHELNAFLSTNLRKVDTFRMLYNLCEIKLLPTKINCRFIYYEYPGQNQAVWFVVGFRDCGRI